MSRSTAIESIAQFRSQYGRYHDRIDLIYLVYTDLKYVKQWHEIELIDIPNLKSYIISGIPYDQVDKEYILPCWVDATLTLQMMASYLADLPSPAVLAFADFDSTLTYFSFEDGITKMAPHIRTSSLMI